MARRNSGEWFIALAFIVVGVLMLLGNLGWIVFNWNMLWSLMLVAFGGWMIWRAFQSNAHPIWQGEWSYGIGDYRPDLAGKEIVRENYSHGLGKLTVDFSRATIPDGQSSARASVGMGELRIVLPRDLAVSIKANAGMGEVRVLGEHSDGIGPCLEFKSDDYATAARKLDVQANVGMGEVRIVRAD